MKLKINWPAGPKQPLLQSNQIHIWCVDLDVTALELMRLKSFLNDVELKRAARFFFDKDRNQFTAARGYLREILSVYTKVAPVALNFKYDNHGKPVLDFPDSKIQFNLSHTRGLAVYAITQHYSVGIDIESLERSVEIDQLATRFFAPAESKILLQTTAELKSSAFFNVWTRKEAFVKALGKGLSFPLNKFVVTSNEPPKLLEIEGDIQKAQTWSLFSLHPVEDYIGALAIEAPKNAIEIICWHWT